MIHYDFINSVLAEFEGKALARGYVPCKDGKPLGASGVTVGTGVDLGQQTRAGLASMGVPEDILVILAPYFGLQKQAAVEKLRVAPLTLTADQVAILDDAVHKHYILGTARRFGSEQFEVAPKEAQAVAVSLCYQFGAPHRVTSPGLGLAWDALRTGDYKKASSYLTNLDWWSGEYHQYIKRRKQEAALLGAIG